jgi:hypothetical protein
MYGSAFSAFCELKGTQKINPHDFKDADMCHWSWFHAGWNAPSRPASAKYIPSDKEITLKLIDDFIADWLELTKETKPTHTLDDFRGWLTRGF